MFKIITTCLLVGILIQSITAQSPECQSWIEQLVKDIMNLDISKVPLPSIMYSGINPNSPGQQYECLNTTGYLFYMVFITNATTEANTYTGLCIPNNCTREDIETVLQPLNAKVYEMKEEADLDGWAITGLVALCGWLLVLIVSSIYASCMEPDENEN